MENFIRFFSSKYTINARGEVVKSNGHRSTPNDVFLEYKNMKERSFSDVDVTLEQIQQYVTEHKPAPLDTDDKEEFNLREYIIKYLGQFANPKIPDQQEWKIGPAWRTIERITHGIPTPSDLTELQNAIRAHAIDHNLSKAAKMDDIRCILSDLAMRANGNRVVSIVNKIRYNPESVGIARDALRKLHSFWKISQSFEVFETLVMHWMWQVKRKLLGRETLWALWINFFGGTAIGKTSFLTALSSPFDDFALATSISKLLDEERQMLKLTASYIINLDELSINNRESLYSDKEGQLGRDQQATLKSLLTQTKMQTRIMGGQRQTTRRLTFSCCSSANEHLYDIIYDEKTMRRYFEFDCCVDKVEDFTDMDEIKTHILDLWKAVNEDLEEGYWNPKCGVWNEIAEEQSKYYPTNTTTGMWIDDTHVVAGTAEDHEEMQGLYDEYKAYCKERGHMNKSYKKWSVDIEHLVKGAKQGKHIYIKIQPEE